MALSPCPPSPQGSWFQNPEVEGKDWEGQGQWGLGSWSVQSWAQRGAREPRLGLFPHRLTTALVIKNWVLGEGPGPTLAWPALPFRLHS